MTTHTTDSADPPGPAATQLRDDLVEAKLLVPSGVDGLYARSATYQQVADGLGALVGRWAAELEATRLHVPPVVTRATLAKTNYLESFPDLLGSVHAFHGGDAEHRELLRRVEGDGDWAAMFGPAEVVLGPSACHSVYPLCSGDLATSRVFEVSGYCFRHEPSPEAMRLQAFVMHEVVLVGSPHEAQAHRDAGLARGTAILEALGLEVRPVSAADPFFGRIGNVLAANQLADQLKIEVVTEAPGTDGSTALLSANCHRDHFGLAFGITGPSGDPAHSACVGFGVDRVVMALFAVHGVDPSGWERSVRRRLGL